MSATWRLGSVIVPVLSVHAMSACQALDRASSCTSTWRRPRRNTPAVKAMLVSSTSPSGIMLPTPATVPRMASPTESSVDSASWLKMSRMAMGMMSHVTNFRMRSVPLRSQAHQREPTGLRGQLVGVRLGADAVGAVPALSGGHEAARQHLVARRLGLGQFAGQQRLVDLEGVGLEHAIGHDLGPLPQLHDVVVDHILQGYLPARRCGPR